MRLASIFRGFFVDQDGLLPCAGGLIAAVDAAVPAAGALLALVQFFEHAGDAAAAGGGLFGVFDLAEKFVAAQGG